MINSEVGVGSCFIVQLPYDALLHCRTDTNNFNSMTPEMIESTLTSPLILLAEDNQANVNSLSSYLQARNFRVQVAKDGYEAVELAVSAQPDVILMDIQMPGLDGLTAIQQIRNSSDSSSQTPIVALTALAKESDHRHCLDAGVDEYLSKPVIYRQVVTVIQELLNQ